MNSKKTQASSNQNLVVKPTPSEYFIYRGAGSREMNWGQIDGSNYFVTNDRFYVHNRSLPPQIDVASWELQVTGPGIALSPQVITYEDILNLPPVFMIKAMVCGADGRGFYPKLPPVGSPSVGNDYVKWRPIAGSEWQYGAMGMAEWTGVLISDVLELAGLKKDVAKSLLIQGLDSVEYSHAIPIDKALADDSLLVYKMNGEPLPIDHGYPIRAFISGWGANSNVKWVGGLEVSDKPVTLDNLPKWQKTQILTGPDYPEPVIVTVQNVKSTFELDWNSSLQGGLNLLHGRAWSGTGTIEKVEVKIEKMDEDHKWQPIWDPQWRQSRFVPSEPVLPQSWVRWQIEWEAEEGYYRLMSKATNNTGETQPAPDEVPWNQSGLLYNGHVGLPVVVTPQPHC
ncbi:MAG: molybdopterin-dependent oxidoreductase [Acidobacteriota bacterium]